MFISCSLSPRVFTRGGRARPLLIPSLELGTRRIYRSPPSASRRRVAAVVFDFFFFSLHIRNSWKQSYTPGFRKLIKAWVCLTNRAANKYLPRSARKWLVPASNPSSLPAAILSGRGCIYIRARPRTLSRHKLQRSGVFYPFPPLPHALHVAELRALRSFVTRVCLPSSPTRPSLPLSLVLFFSDANSTLSLPSESVAGVASDATRRRF